VGEYWVVDRYEETIEVYRLEHGQLVLAFTLVSSDELATPLLPSFRCQVSQVFED
jgi:Uma2 family endonuclease